MCFKKNLKKFQKILLKILKDFKRISKVLENFESFRKFSIKFRKNIENFAYTVNLCFDYLNAATN